MGWRLLLGKNFFTERFDDTYVRRTVGIASPLTFTLPLTLTHLPPSFPAPNPLAFPGIES